MVNKAGQCEMQSTLHGMRTLCWKVLTHSDVTTEIAKLGRLVLPRAQTTMCLQSLLHLGGAGTTLLKGRLPSAQTPGVNLMAFDLAGRCWRFQLKTWHNVVTDGGRPTYVLENTAEFMASHGLVTGSTLAICDGGDRLVLLAGVDPTALGGKRGAAKAGRRRRSAGGNDGAASAAGVASGAPASAPSTPLSVLNGAPLAAPRPQLPASLGAGALRGPGSGNGGGSGQFLHGSESLKDASAPQSAARCAARAFGPSGNASAASLQLEASSSRGSGEATESGASLRALGSTEAMSMSEASVALLALQGASRGETETETGSIGAASSAPPSLTVRINSARSAWETPPTALVSQNLAPSEANRLALAVKLEPGHSPGALFGPPGRASPGSVASAQSCEEGTARLLKPEAWARGGGGALGLWARDPLPGVGAQSVPAAPPLSVASDWFREAALGAGAGAARTGRTGLGCFGAALRPTPVRGSIWVQHDARAKSWSLIPIAHTR